MARKSAWKRLKTKIKLALTHDPERVLFYREHNPQNFARAYLSAKRELQKEHGIDPGANNQQGENHGTR